MSCWQIHCIKPLIEVVISPACTPLLASDNSHTNPGCICQYRQDQERLRPASRTAAQGLRDAAPPGTRPSGWRSWLLPDASQPHTSTLLEADALYGRDQTADPIGHSFEQSGSHRIIFSRNTQRVPTGRLHTGDDSTSSNRLHAHDWFSSQHQQQCLPTSQTDAQNGSEEDNAAFRQRQANHGCMQETEIDRISRIMSRQAL